MFSLEDDTTRSALFKGLASIRLDHETNLMTFEESNLLLV